MVKEKLTDTPQLFDWFQKITNINKKKKSYAQVLTYCASIFSSSLLCKINPDEKLTLFTNNKIFLIMYDMFL